MAMLCSKLQFELRQLFWTSLIDTAVGVFILCNSLAGSDIMVIFVTLAGIGVEFSIKTKVKHVFSFLFASMKLNTSNDIDCNIACIWKYPLFMLMFFLPASGSRYSATIITSLHKEANED